MHTVSLTSSQMLDILIALGDSVLANRKAGFNRLAQEAEDLRTKLRVEWYPLMEAAREKAA